MKAIYPLFFFAGAIFALPQAPTIVSGTIDISKNSSTLEVFASNRAIVNWEDFSILEGERATFTLAAPTHAILNRVTGPNQSLIFGQLECNGQMILINPSGVLFGPNSTINTSSLLISTLDLLDDDFLNGTDLHFSSGSNEIVNQGKITTEGDLYFLAPSIKQSGTCTSKNGQVTIDSCSEAILNTPDGKIRLLPIEEMETAEMIQALQARLLTDGNLSSLAINLDGIIETPDLLVTGKRINLGPEASIDLTHSENGGKCHILATESISMAPSAIIDASSLSSGHGGEVILFSDGTTLFEGHINAQGGPLQGNGGFVEVSGSHLAFRGTVSTQAPNGKVGTLLLDPVDITIQSPTATTNVNGLPNGPFTPVNGSACAGMGGSSILLDTDLTNALLANSVLISTVGSVGACNGDIIFDPSATVNYSTANSLTLAAAGSVLFNSSVINTGAGGISISQAGGDVILTAGATPLEVQTNGGAISIIGVVGNLEIYGGTAMNALGRIVGVGSTIDVDIGGDIIITGGSQSGASAELRAQVSTMTITNAANIVVTGGTNSGASASLIGTSNANVLITCETMTVNTTASGAAAAVSADNDLTLNVTNGDLEILADGGGSAAVNASFNLNTTVSGNILLSATNNGYAALFGDKGNATIETVNGSIRATATMNGFTQIYSGQNGVNPLFLLVIAGTDIITSGNGSIDSFSPTGGTTLVVDNLFPTSPGIGPGQLNLGAGTAVTTNGGNILQLFTATSTQNSILATLNGVPFVQGPPLTDTNTEQYGVYYPNPFFVADYAVFYKIPINSPTPIIPTIVTAIQPELADFSEMFRFFHPYSEYIYGSLRFSDSYNDPETLFGIPEQPADFYRLRKKSNTQSWIEIVYDPAKF